VDEIQVSAVKRIVILGRGGAGKSTLAQELGRILSIPVTELDILFWKPGPQATPKPEWAQIQRRLVTPDRWIVDGDLGPYDTDLALRLSAADTIVILDFPLWRCIWRSLRRSHETREYWCWVYRYRRNSLPTLTQAITIHAQHADVQLSPAQGRKLRKAMLTILHRRVSEERESRVEHLRRRRAKPWS
jgi:adenylate kinase family enzyme